MNNLLFKMKYLVLALLIAFSFSCSTEDGERGPQGEQGIPGVDGKDGNANVISVLFENQTISVGNNVFNIPELTQDIYDNGIVYAYATVGSNAYWEVLPLSSGGNTILEIDRIEVGQATLKATFTQSNLRIRFVLVAGTPAGMASEGLSHMSYKEAMDYFGLEY
ncbi:hypothetical protein V8G61_04205 [Gaetbulibacter sp. M240]|uniref:hypothetical protein n=1 Tax=Gaetbulibacter sp. M240 TaxID=3126511 RepID=UPI00374F7BCA